MGQTLSLLDVGHEPWSSLSIVLTLLPWSDATGWLNKICNNLRLLWIKNISNRSSAHLWTLPSPRHFGPLIPNPHPLHPTPHRPLPSMLFHITGLMFTTNGVSDQVKFLFQSATSLSQCLLYLRVKKLGHWCLFRRKQPLTYLMDLASKRTL